MTGLAARLRAGETLFTGWSAAFPDPLAAEACARAGFDCVTLDVQHGLHHTASVIASIGSIALAGKPALIRLPVGDAALASRVLDMGAEAVIAPMVNSVADAKALAAATKYPPLGERSWGPARVRMLRGTGAQEHLDSANTDTLAFAMIETTRAVAALDAILAVPGIDGVFVGPSDLSVTLSGGRVIAPLDASLDHTIADIAKSATAAGKVAGIFAATPERAKQFQHLGYRLIALATDGEYLANGARALLAAVR